MQSLEDCMALLYILRHLEDLLLFLFDHLTLSQVLLLVNGDLLLSLSELVVEVLFIILNVFDVSLHFADHVVLDIHLLLKLSHHCEMVIV